MKLRYIFAIFLSTLLLSSCIPEDDPVAPFDRGDMLINSVSMGESYYNQVYFSLENNQYIKSNLITDWDLGFSCSEDSHYIILNSSKFMRAAKITNNNFESISESILDEISDEDWNYDNSKGDLDSTAIGVWWDSNSGNVVSKNDIFIIDRGVNERGREQGKVKLRILNYSNSSYQIEYADLEDGIVYSSSISKNNNYNFVHFSFDTPNQTFLYEPPTLEWDLVFMKYTDLLYTSEGEGVWYSVTGAYINRAGVEVAQIESEDFESISAEIIDTLDFTTDLNVIGHDWKYYSLDVGSFAVFPEMVYIIKSINGFYYKFHFVDFYDDSGIKGNPKFEFKLL